MKSQPTLLLPLAGALLMALAQDASWAAPLVLVGMVPLYVSLETGGFFRTWLRLAVFFSAFHLLALFWIQRLGQGAGWLLLPVAIYAALFTAIPAAAVALSKGLTARLLILAPAWMAMEVLGKSILFRISWPLLGLPLADYPVLSQVAAIGGPESTTFLAALVNAGLACCVLGNGRGRRRGAAIAAGSLALALIFGALQLATAPVASAILRAGVVQPMTSQRIVWSQGNRAPMLQKMDGLIDAVAARRPDLIVLPEWAVVGALRQDAGLAQFATGAVRRTGIPVLLGAGDFEAGRFYNAATLIATDGRVFTYRKTRLIPFVEYTPAILPVRLNSGWVRFTPGNDPGVFMFTPDFALAPLICLEDAMPELAREFANKGATVLVGMINTENFAGTPEALQHLRRARLTAIAVGLPMLRAANSGVSCALDSRGRVLQALPPERVAADILELPAAGRTTPFRWFGPWPVLAVLISILAMRIK